MLAERARAAGGPTWLPGAGATLGVLGGGQLGRMFAQAAQAMGYDVAVLDPQADGPAGQVSPKQHVAAYDDPHALDALAAQVQACTTEFESVPAASLARLAERVRVAPSAQALAICQHRAREKAQFAAVGVPCAPHACIESPADVLAAQGLDLYPAILKTSTLGYDGKGQVSVTRADQLEQAWASLKQAPCLLEQRLPLALEFSIIVARGQDGHCVSLPAQQNLHLDGILAVTQVPAPDVPAAVVAQAQAAVRELAAAMSYVGVLCVEFFLLQDGSLVANEMAPRPHNSGHHSLDASDVSQFELQVRTLAGLPLTEPRQHSTAVMLNLLGDLWFRQGAAEPTDPDWAAVLALPGVHLHLYGKREARRGRKMGHLTVTAPDLSGARATAQQAAQCLGLPGF
jgi:5-(carboxyamino)imidazole ribonucleotide synthase